MNNKIVIAQDGSRILIAGETISYTSSTGVITGSYQSNSEVIEAALKDIEKDGGIASGRYLLYLDNLCQSCCNSECAVALGERSISPPDTCGEFIPRTLRERIECLESGFLGYVGSCPLCESTNVTNCTNKLEPVFNPSIGICHDCGTYYCAECRLIFGKARGEYAECPHQQFCQDCINQNKFMEVIEFRRTFCRGCEHYLDDASGPLGCCDKDKPCETQKKYSCPYAWESRKCPKVQALKKMLQSGCARPEFK